MLSGSFVQRRKRQWVAAGLPDYPLWISAFIDSSAIVTAAVAVGQRWGDGALLAAGLMVVALLPWSLELWAQGRTWPAFVSTRPGSGRRCSRSASGSPATCTTWSATR
ncbi:MAG TPA: hypothetical protein VFV89_05810 [Nocardioides sp.]|uniref:hypothetical protein n=1 Tax=Nocardioides sp. TaxID=35761 RepID=UPI002E36EE38|nr:hypothetical protein [Nocardioides sp.]HEX5087303.1 hypothetical protein [Nocardioides sp.]